MDESTLIEQFKAVSFATLGHFLEEGFADSQLRAMVPNVKLVGRALTLKLVGADAIAVNQALALIQPGDVLVIDTDGDWQHAPVGAVTSCAALCAGAVGIVVDGAVTDLLELREAGLPVFARGTSVLTTKLHGRGDSEINQPIHCGPARWRLHCPCFPASVRVEQLHNGGIVVRRGNLFWPCARRRIEGCAFYR